MAVCFSPPWRWECEKGQCVKKPLLETDFDSAISLNTCQMFCGDAGLLWPKPTGSISLGDSIVKIDLNQVKLAESFEDEKLKELFNKSLEVSNNAKVFKEQIIYHKKNNKLNSIPHKIEFYHFI